MTFGSLYVFFMLCCREVYMKNIAEQELLGKVRIVPLQAEDIILYFVLYSVQNGLRFTGSLQS